MPRKGQPMMSPEYQRAWRAKNPELVAGYDAKRRAQHRVWSKEWRSRNPDKLKATYERRKLRNYGLTLEQYGALHALQDGRCAICREAETKGKTVVSRGRTSYERRRAQLAIDHNHKSRRVRGLLCCNCNAILGHAKDDIERLQRAITYLEAWQ